MPEFDPHTQFKTTWQLIAGALARAGYTTETVELSRYRVIATSTNGTRHLIITGKRRTEPSSTETFNIFEAHTTAISADDFLAALKEDECKSPPERPMNAPTARPSPTTPSPHTGEPSRAL